MRRLLALAACLLALELAACGRSGDGEELVVSAASSMTGALSECAPEFAAADVHLSFAGSDQLAAQIRQGVAPDAYAAANDTLPAQLHEEGLLSRPVAFASNELVIAVPADSPIEALGELGEPGVKLAVGADSVPVGSYTQEVLARLPATEREAILANVRSAEPEVAGIVGKLLQGSVDAGFVYASDVRGAAPDLRAIVLPSALQPTVVYAAGVPADAARPQLGRRFIADLLGGPCRQALTRAGFGPRP